MCTAISDGHLFGRTFDLERSYGEAIVLTPRAWRFKLGQADAFSSRYALLGVATVRDGIPLYYDGMNEKGVAIAALNFPQSAVYHPAKEGFCNLPSFALIPYLLSQCETAKAAATLLGRVNITPEGFSPDLPPSPLHFLLADKEDCFTVESLACGLVVRENPVGVLANEPDFVYHLTHLADFSALSALPPENTLCEGVTLPLYSRGLGAFGLPGDFSSPSRFVRAVYLKNHRERGDGISPVNAFFHIMDNLAVPRGAVKLADGLAVSTRYTSCADLAAGVYFVVTEADRAIRSVSFGDGMDQRELTVQPL